jgi:uncharacterized LabA/DUF88 family protein
MAVVAVPLAPVPLTKVRVFVDYWNFQLSLNEHEAKATGKTLDETRFAADWRGLGPWLTRKACEAAGIASYSFDGVIIYSSFDPRYETGRKFKNWIMGLARSAGIQVFCAERKRKAPAKCPECHKRIDACPHCTKPIVAMGEKGVDTLIATDMIRLAWEGAYDLAVLATSDSDLVPAVQFLNTKGRKVVQAGFPPLGSNLASVCWASFDVGKYLHEIKRN